MRFSSFKILFPGIVLHELSHYLACLFVGVKVYNVKLFDSREAFVQHAKPNAWQSLAITVAPFAVNNFLGIWLLFFAGALLAAQPIVSLPLYWLAVAFVFHSFPSASDAMNSFRATKLACLKRLKKGSLLARLTWLALTPFIFLPVLFLTGIMLLFDKSEFLKLAWVFLALLFSWQPQHLLEGIANIFI